ncbi:hypothetical protein [Paenibacillus apiarius]|uniref:hypothetical protein n=1 Tax=Paenibacillus apiarius TaxID=46240 RepID=UPI003B3B97AD
MKRRIAKKQLKAAQRKQERLQAAWDVVVEELHSQKDNVVFFVKREVRHTQSHIGFCYYLDNVGGFKLVGNKFYPIRTEVHR